MMHARHLVRLLLDLRRSRATLDQPLLDVGQSLGAYPQSSGNSHLGESFLALVGQRGQTENQSPVGAQSYLGDNIALGDGHRNRLDEQQGLAVNYDGLSGQTGIFGQQGLPFDQSLNVSGFWVPFKRKTA